MIKKIIYFLAAVISLIPLAAGAYTATYTISASDIVKGYITEKIWLSEYAKPGVVLSDINYQTGVALPKGAKASDPSKFDIIMGMERKRPFALVRIPAYLGGGDSGKAAQLSGFTMTVTEQPAGSKTANKTSGSTYPANSVLNSGTWYKIAVPATGLYKIDYNFLTSIGLNPANVNPADIRVFGNGGHMLSEDNAVWRPSDLLENTVWSSDNGDAVFDKDEFLVFYAVGPVEWDKDSADGIFTHQNNIYSDSSYYFITVDQGAGLRITTQQNAPTANETVTEFNDYAVHDTDIANPGQLGREWYGEEFGTSAGLNSSVNFQFNFASNIDALTCNVLVGTISNPGTAVISVALNGQTMGSGVNGPTTDDNPIVEGAPITFNAAPGSATANVAISVQGSSLTAYLNYIELNIRRSLTVNGSQMGFRDWQSVGAGKIAGYQLQGANSATQIWDVTYPQTPVKMNGSLNGSVYTFSQDASMLHEFIVLNSTDLPSPSYSGAVANQNLHGSGQVNCIIVTYPGFEDAANQLADFHRQKDNMSVIVATTTQVYNEFSSGSQDISAIRDFTKMFYDRAGTDTTQMPAYLILFGGASYDYKDRVANNSNYVPTYESPESHSLLNGFCTDDFFGFLDDNENIENNGVDNTFDIGVGRIPARDDQAALNTVSKIMSYKTPSTLGPWRIASTFVADNADDAGNHLGNAETMAHTVNMVGDDLYNESKVYVDAIPVISTPAGPRCPNANAAIDAQVYQGTFLVNYNGHGNIEVWATERILTQDDYNNWNNPTKLPFTITATCDFGQFDHPQYVSAGEQLVMENNAGVIAALTTTQESYASSNAIIDSDYLSAQFTRLGNGGWNRFGDAYRIGKNMTYFDPGDDISNLRKFALLGDPALLPDFPQYYIHIDSMIDGATLQPADSVKALGAYIIKGSVLDLNANLLSSFNGDLSVAFYDKPASTTVSTYYGQQTFQLQNSVIYKGKASVTNGQFSFTFIAPKDINYNYGKGKISTYADNGLTDAAGTDSTFSVGGFSDNPVISTTAPIVEPYMNDSLFIDGGITGNNSVLFVKLMSNTGINVSGTDVGHDLTGVLDSNISTPYILNDFYQTAPNTYQVGYISYPISGLPDGKHSITVRAWDVNDNEGEGKVDFVVVDGNVVDVQQLMNYPNPFSDVTHFIFEQNHPNEALDVQINIYNTAGILVKTIKQSFTPTGSRTNEITWDGTADSGARLPSGVYVYKMNLATETGIKTTAYQKLVLIR